MDQDSFRQLLKVPHPGSSSSLNQVGTSRKSDTKVILDPSKPAFQPRKVKKKEKQSDYRDRASERRAGVNEYAEVESVLEEFEQRTADLEDREAVEEQRRYLGGDRDHTILVKGLDLALLEQNKARAAVSHGDDDSLEAAFQEAKVPVPKKRTREDLVQELKEKRAAGGVSSLPIPSEPENALEAAKKVGKFKPIGAPDRRDDKEVVKKTKSKRNTQVAEGGRRKKRRKIVHGSTEVSGNDSLASDRSQSMLPPPVPFAPGNSTARDQSAGLESSGIAEMESDDVDIFADVGDYEGVDLGDEDEDEDGQNDVIPSPPVAEVPAAESLRPNANAGSTKWFVENEDRMPQPDPSFARAATPPVPEPQEDPGTEQPTRLAPLASSALPSISDFLAMDAQADSRKKKRAKKEKKQGERKGKASTDMKVDRDYQKLNSYMAKKGGKNVEA